MMLFIKNIIECNMFQNKKNNLEYLGFRIVPISLEQGK